MSVARTSTGIETALLVHPDGTLVTAATAATAESTTLFGEIKMFLVEPEDGRWAQLDGKPIDGDKHRRLAQAYGDRPLPKIERMWVYAG